MEDREKMIELVSESLLWFYFIKAPELWPTTIGENGGWIAGYKSREKGAEFIVDTLLTKKIAK